MRRVLTWFEKHYIISLIITILIAIFIFYMSSKTFEKGTPIEFPYKAIAYHFLIFFIFAFFLSISLIKGKKNNKYWILIAMLIATAYGITDELHQLFVPNRFCAVNDFLIDSAGVTLSGLFYAIRLRRIKPHQRLS